MEQGRMIRRYIIWRNKHAADQRLREVLALSTACASRRDLTGLRAVRPASPAAR